ncbi:MAG: deoxyguanosinetriphosphate triphosphohydrolase family protein [Dehalococcoidia bacterium]
MVERDARFYPDNSGTAGDRSPAARDRDRLIHTSAFRRLAGVTQVAAAAEGEGFHNRLTHTLEVAQLARRVAERLVKQHGQANLSALGGLDPEVAEAAAIAHDLGHPPFGHVGESELNQCMKRHGNEGFEGNAQSFRIVCSLALRSVSHTGLNLTRATLNAILKYPWPEGTSGKPAQKWGFYGGERAHFDFARAAEGANSPLKSLEAEIMDWADDVAYAVHDVYDFYRAGLIPLHVLVHNPPEWDRLVDDVLARTEDELARGVRNEALDRGVVTRLRLILESLLPTDAFAGTIEHRGQLRSWSSAMITRFVGKEAFDVNSEFDGVASRVWHDADRRQEVTFLQEITRQYVIRNPATQSVQFGQRRIIRDLFDLFMADKSLLEDHATATSPYPAALREALRQIPEGPTSAALKARAVSDSISAMTEDQVIGLHRRLTGAALGSMFDPIVR